MGGAHKAPTITKGPTEMTECRIAHPNPRYTELVWVSDDKGDRRQEERPTVFCTRLTGHDGAHAAYTFSVRTPETWGDESIAL